MDMVGSVYLSLPISPTQYHFHFISIVKREFVDVHFSIQHEYKSAFQTNALPLFSFFPVVRLLTH